MSAAPRSILVLAFPRAQLLDVTGPLQVFASVNELAQERGQPAPYAPRVVAADAGPIETSSGLVVMADSLRSAGRPDTVIVAGGKGVQAASRDARMVRWVRQQAQRARRVASVCTGAFLLAEAGLLDGRRAVTHWARCDEFAARYPNVRVEADPIFIREGSLWTSAGVTAGIDLALKLIEDDHGRDVALSVARRLVVFLKRPGGQSQFSAHLAAQLASEGRIQLVQHWILDHLSLELTVSTLAARAAMSVRNFTRVFQQETGITPADFVEMARVDSARRLLEDTDKPLQRVASSCGFANPDTMRRAFVRRIGTGPSEYRERFRG